MIAQPPTVAGRSRGREAGAGAFTLVELLVVVCIVALLVALSLPVIQSVRLSASQVVAASALHQLAAAGQGYLADNHNVYWPFRNDTADGTTYWFGYETAADSALPEGQRTIDYSRGALGPYSGGLHDVHPDPQFSRMGATFKPKFKDGCFPYGYNDLLAGTSQSAIPSLTGRVVFATSAQVNTFQAPASSANPMLEEFYMVDDSNVTASFRYHGQALCAFADGSLGFVSPAPGTQDSRLPGGGVAKLPTTVLQ